MKKPKTREDWAGQVERLERRIKELESLNYDFMGMVENSYDGIAIVDKDTRLIKVNSGFVRVMGFSGVEGRKITELIDEGYTDTAASTKVLETGRPQTVLINTRSGRQVLSTGIPVHDNDGSIWRIYCNLRDVTELNTLREKCEQSQTLISRYLTELQEVKRARVLESDLIARSRQMNQALDTACRLAHFDTTVLILGESGVGKDLLARIIHEASPRKETGIFVKINCGAIPGTLLESELFGYKDGAFTGASKEGKPGYFEIADKGTFFLDEIGDLPMELQSKILSAIQDQEVTRIGDVRSKKIDVRLLAATNQDLESMVRAGRFREDLYYRLAVVPLRIPPLRERKEDIPFLLAHYLRKHNKKYQTNLKIGREAVEILKAYPWPGNVRELANLVENLIVVAEEPVIQPEHLPARHRSIGKLTGEVGSDGDGKPLRERLEEIERALVQKAVRGAASHEEAAHRLGISLSTLTRRLRKYKYDVQC
ncbi:MAG: sigma 54-interacting transcriptional regulator [Deltaproteobacteria bacterium]|nr:sigma 54-interacting transcriptional regulator [Deltaproteobacteria bacterium]